MSKEIIISPSILAANFLKLGEEIKMLNQSRAQWIHIDVMDGTFVPNISFGTPVMEAIQPIAKKILDVHLMIVQPEKYFERFRKLGAEIITFHYEAVEDINQALDSIHALGAKAGISISPDTPVSAIESYLDNADLVLIMGVHPGFSYQKFIPTTLDKVSELKQLINKRGCSCQIEVDGGVGLSNAKELAERGADALVAGGAVFSSEQPEKVISQLIDILKSESIA